MKKQELIKRLRILAPLRSISSWNKESKNDLEKLYEKAKIEYSKIGVNL